VIDDDIRRMASVLEALVRLSDLSVREVERRLDLGAGTLNRIFSGRIDLKVRHILRVLEVIGMRPERYFQLAAARALADDAPASASASLLDSFERLGYGRSGPTPQPSRQWSNEELDRRIEAVLDRILGGEAQEANADAALALSGGGGIVGGSGGIAGNGGGAPPGLATDSPAGAPGRAPDSDE
jgi:plasmid maintenance system antidote protein VapI